MQNLTGIAIIPSRIRTNYIKLKKKIRNLNLRTFGDKPIPHYKGNDIREYLRNYCDITTLHGFKWITKNSSTCYDRLTWLMIVTFAISACLALLIITYYWNSETPTLYSIDSSHAPLYNFPFPAITICNLNRISKAKAFELARQFKRSSSNITDEELARLFRLTMYFFRSLPEYPESEYQKLQQILIENRYTTGQLIEELTPTCSELLIACMWKGTVDNCLALFQTVRTYEGICCSFNYFGVEETTYPPKYKGEVSLLPLRVTGCGYQMGITVLLNPNEDDYFGTCVSSRGIRFLVHDSYNYPDQNADVKHLTTLQDGYAWIIPTATYSESNVRRLPISERKCFFPDERRLHVMRKYTYVNCLAECRSHFIFEKCGCVPDNLPRNSTMKICEIEKAPCFLKYIKYITSAIPGTTNPGGTDKKILLPCNCLPDCQSNSYQLDVTTGNLDRKYSFNYPNLFKGITLKDQIFLKAFFNDLVGTRYRITLFQDWLSMLASFGGLVGLIMGFSIVSALEFVFAIIVRPILGRYNL